MIIHVAVHLMNAVARELIEDFEQGKLYFDVRIEFAERLFKRIPYNQRPNGILLIF